MNSFCTVINKSSVSKIGQNVFEARLGKPEICVNVNPNSPQEQSTRLRSTDCLKVIKLIRFKISEAKEKSFGHQVNASNTHLCCIVLCHSNVVFHFIPCSFLLILISC